MINLNLMERVVARTTRMNNEPTLSNTANIFLNVLFVVILLILNMREYWIRLADDFHWLEFTIFADSDKTPVIEAAFPEFAKVNLHFLHDIVLFNDIAIFNFMPRQQIFIVTLNW